MSRSNENSIPLFVCCNGFPIQLNNSILTGSVFMFWTEKRYFFKDGGKNLSKTYFFQVFSVQNPGVFSGVVSA